MENLFKWLRMRHFISPKLAVVEDGALFAAGGRIVFG